MASFCWKMLVRLLLICLLIELAAFGQGNQGSQIQVTITVKQHAARLSWNGSTQPIASWNVYRSTTHGGGYAVIASVTAQLTSYVDQTVQAGQTYYYVITAVAPACSGGQPNPCGESLYSAEVSGTVPTP